MDSSGLKVYGEGKWKVRQHGGSKRRTWRKMRLSVDMASGEVQAAMLSTAGASDAEMVEPMLAQIEEPIAGVAANGSYDKRSVYHSLQARAPGADAVFRFKTIFGDHLSIRLLTTQATQFGARCRALNIMTHLGMPDSYKVD
jgi:hypothetical protein